MIPSPRDRLCSFLLGPRSTHVCTRRAQSSSPRRRFDSIGHGRPIFTSGKISLGFGRPAPKCETVWRVPTALLPQLTLVSLGVHMRQIYKERGCGFVLATLLRKPDPDLYVSDYLFEGVQTGRQLSAWAGQVHTHAAGACACGRRMCMWQAHVHVLVHVHVHVLWQVNRVVGRVVCGVRAVYTWTEICLAMSVGAPMHALHMWGVAFALQLSLSQLSVALLPRVGHPNCPVARVAIRVEFKDVADGRAPQGYLRDA